MQISVYILSLCVRFVGSTTATSNRERSKEELYKRAPGRAVTGGGGAKLRGGAM